jgi:hypothetical protein
MGISASSPNETDEQQQDDEQKQDEPADVQDEHEQNPVAAATDSVDDDFEALFQELDSDAAAAGLDLSTVNAGDGADDADFSGM